MKQDIAAILILLWLRFRLNENEKYYIFNIFFYRMTIAVVIVSVKFFNIKIYIKQIDFKNYDYMILIRVLLFHHISRIIFSPQF